MKRKIAVALLALLVFAGLSGYAYAANTNQIYFTKYCSAGSYTSVSDPAEKTNNTNVYLYLRSLGSASSANVRVMGCNGTMVGAVNCTIYNHVWADHVTAQLGISYSIESTVYGGHYSHAAVCLMTGGGGTAVGFWAPDTNQE